MNEVTAGSREPRVEVRFGPVGLAQVRIRTTDPAVVEADLAGRVATAPKMFDRMPVALDLNELDRAPDRAALRAVLDAIRRAGFIPIGFARGTEAVDTLARELEMPILMQFRAPKRPGGEARPDDLDGDLLGTAPASSAPGVPADSARSPAARPVAARTPAVAAPQPERTPSAPPTGAAPAAAAGSNRTPGPVPTAGVPMTPAAAAAARRAGLNRPPSLRDPEVSPPPVAAAAEPTVDADAPASATALDAASHLPPTPAGTPRAGASRADGAAEPAPSLLHVQTVRSGQRVYARNRDLVVTATVGAGAEVMADGCVHVYGSLRGRAMAGARGDTAARVFCQEFHAELVSIAGVFRVFETIPPELEGQPVQAWLDGEDLGAFRPHRSRLKPAGPH
jgi:septum formation inhibitor MinC